MFQVGQKVVCIKSTPWAAHCGAPVPPRMPARGGIYTIQEIEVWRDREFLVLKEFGTWDSFHSRNFRPIVQKKTDISIFTAMLNNVPMHDKEHV